MRAFISCQVPNSIAAYLSTLVPLLPKVPLSIPREFDLTLKFLGEVSETLLPEIQTRLSTIQFPAFQAQLSPIGFFSERIIRVVWAGVGPIDLFTDLHSIIDETLCPLFQKENRFLPHITLARVQHIHNRQAFLEHLSNIVINPISFSISRFSLMKSDLTAKGAFHTPLFDIALQ